MRLAMTGGEGVARGSRSDHDCGQDNDDIANGGALLDLWKETHRVGLFHEKVLLLDGQVMRISTFASKFRLKEQGSCRRIVLSEQQQRHNETTTPARIWR
jgi:hypothetical protein